MTDPPQASAARPGPALLSAAAVVILGTAAVDASRLALLPIPLSFLLAAYAAGLLLDLLPHSTGTPNSDDGPSIAGLAVRLGSGLAVLALVMTTCAVLLGYFKIAGLVVGALAAYGIALLLRAGLHIRPRPSYEWLPSIAGGCGFGLLWLFAWLWGTIPPTFYDELAYHLVIPQQALATGATPALPWVYFTFMPHVSDLWLAWGMAFGGDIGARALHVGIWTACTLSAWGLAESLAWPKPAAWAGLPVAGALASSATFWYLGTLPFAETALTGALLTAACLLIRAQDKPSPWLLMGLLLGLAASVKLSGLAWALAGLVAAFAAGWAFKTIVRAALVALACVAPWLARAFIHTGNPVYPLGYGIFGGRYWNQDSQARLHADLPPDALDLGWEALLRLPLDLVQHPERFGSAADAGLLAVAATGLLLLGPFVCRIMRGGRRAIQLADAAALFTLLAGTAWLLTSTTTRFFAPALALGLTVLAGLTLRLRWWGQTTATILLLLCGVWGLDRFLTDHQHVFAATQVALGRESADAYLTRQLDHHEAARFVRERTPADASLLFIGEARPYYFARTSLAPYPFQDHPLGQWVREAASPEELARRVAAEGFTHVILNVREYKRLRDQYGLLAFRGEDGAALDRRLKELPSALRTVFAKNGIYVFAVPARSAGGPTIGTQP